MWRGYNEATSENVPEEILVSSRRAVSKFVKEVSEIVGDKPVTFLMDADRNSIDNGSIKHSSYFELMKFEIKNSSKLFDFNIIDMRETFENHFLAQGKRFEFPTDGHWNELGHTVAAEKYNEYLKY